MFNLFLALAVLALLVWSWMHLDDIVEFFEALFAWALVAAAVVVPCGAIAMIVYAVVTRG